MKLNPEKAIDFYWFSGTGNTLYIAEALAGFLAENGFEVNLKPIETSDPAKVDLSRTTGLGIPVAEQGTYPFIWDFIKYLPSPDIHGINDADVFMVDTLMLYSGGIKGPVKKILKKKGFHLLGAKEIVMPNNLMKLKNQPDKDQLKMARGKEVVEKFGMDLISGESVWKDIPLYSDMMGRISKMKSTWNLFRNKFPLKVDHDKCIRCRLCERICPVQSWSYDTGKNEMKWLKADCIYCLRCFSYCPTEAISYGKKKYLRHKPLTADAFLAVLRLSPGLSPR